ncbi:hypothetical protein ACSVIJ_05580 [Pseudomonas sp. NCHU5208]|uniref:hypothetical protein n=1 Tax=unclassified Pseudomonas TaxID=196821 RepID=UPI003F99BAA1
MYAHPAIELKAVSRLMLCSSCSRLPSVTRGPDGEGFSAACACGVETHAISLTLLVLSWNRGHAGVTTGRMVRGEIYDVYETEVPKGSSFRVRLTHGDLSTFNRWLAAVCGVEARSADPAELDFYYLLRAPDRTTDLPGGLVVRNGSVVEIQHSEFIAAEINIHAQRALDEIQVLVDRAMLAVS